MIKVNELRIGNWVLDDGEPGIISGIGFGGISFFTINGFNCNRETGSVLESGIDKFKPIPLTPEILEKAGFIQVSDYDPEGPTHRMNSSIGVIDVCYGYHIVDIVQNIGRIRHNKIKYLHQLQNLYFSLTGEELIINL